MELIPDLRMRFVINEIPKLVWVGFQIVQLVLIRKVDG